MASYHPSHIMQKPLRPKGKFFLAADLYPGFPKVGYRV